MAAIEYEPELTSYDMCDHPDRTLVDYLDSLRGSLTGVEDAIDFDTEMARTGVRASKETAKKAYSYGDGVFWSFLDIRSQCNAISLYTPGNPIVAEMIDWSKVAEAKWQCADFVARDAIEDRKYRDAINALHQGYVRLRTGTIRHELSTLIRRADKQLAELLESKKRTAPSPILADSPIVMGKKLNANDLLAVAVARDIASHGERATGRSLGYWESKTDRRRSTLQNTPVWNAIRRYGSQPEPTDEILSCDYGSPRLQDGRRIGRKAMHRSESERSSLMGGVDHSRSDG